MNNDLIRLASFVPILRDRTFRVGEWVGGVTNAEGVMTMPFFQRGADLNRFVDACHPLFVPLSWSEWIRSDDGARVRHDLEHATREELSKFVTATVRQERFVEGTLARAYEDGVLLRIAERAEELAHVS